MLLTTARSYRNRAFMEAAKRLGIEVLQVVNMEEQLAEHWDYPLGVDFSQPDVAAKQIAEFARQTPVAAIRAVDDSGTLVAAKASVLLGLPQNDPVAAEAARDKLRMRTLFASAGVPCPRFECYHTSDDLNWIAAEQVEYPCVVKPLDLSGSRGVMRANGPDEFLSTVQRLIRILQADRPDESSFPFLVESFIPGCEVALEGLLTRGQLRVLAIFDKPDPLDGPFFEETIYVTPTRFSSQIQEGIAACAAKSAAALGLREGPIHAEMRINDEGVWILEVAGRSIGGLCSQTLRFGWDISLEELILRQACQLPIAYRDINKDASGVMMIPIPEAGILKGIAGIEEARQVSLVAEVEITAKLNYSLTPLPEGDSYLGFIFARGQSPDEVEQALREAHAKLKFNIIPELALIA